MMEKLCADYWMISSWQQENSCVVPEDVRDIYLMTDGSPGTECAARGAHCSAGRRSEQ